MKQTDGLSRDAIRNGFSESLYDVAVIGGGITGSGIARDASNRGLKTILLEKDDFASGTSSKSGKLVHGGLRYLNYGQFKMVYESCKERHYLRSKVAPHIVKPVPFLISFYPESSPGRWKVASGLFLYDILSLYRNVRGFRVLSKHDLTKLEPGLNTHKSKGGLRFWDCMSLDYRLTINTLKSAAESGAHLLNYQTVKTLNKKTAEKPWHEIICEDSIDRTQSIPRAKVVINAAGAWADDVLESLGQKKGFGLKISKGVHLVLDNSDYQVKNAIGFHDLESKRQIYAVPWGNRLLLGTTDSFYTESKDQIPIYDQDIDYLLQSVKKIFPGIHPKRKDVISAYAGIRPLIGSDSDKSESEMSRDFEIKIDHDGLVSITGGKLTTYRHMAQTLMNQVCDRYFPQHRHPDTSTLSPISGGHMTQNPHGFGKPGQEQISQESIRHLQEYYGSNSEKILDYVEKNKKSGDLISPDSPHIWAEIDYGLEHEFALTLADIMIRRTTLYLFAPDNGLKASEAIARYMAPRLNWNEERIRHEVSSYQSQVSQMKHMVEGKGKQ